MSYLDSFMRAASACQIPLGYNFHPTDAELVGHYLRSRIFGLPLFCDKIKDGDLYGTQEPWQIWELYGGFGLEDLYFFTPLKKKSPKGSRISRKIGSGVWQGEDGAKQIKDGKSHKIIGLKKRFRYENKGSEHHGQWIMMEYTLLGYDQFVLCRIRKNDQSTSKKWKSLEVVHIDEEVCQSNKCCRTQSDALCMLPIMDTHLNDHDFTESSSSAVIEEIFPGLSTDNECMDLGDIFANDQCVDKIRPNP